MWPSDLLHQKIKHNIFHNVESQVSGTGKESHWKHMLRGRHEPHFSNTTRNSTTTAEQLRTGKIMRATQHNGHSGKKDRGASKKTRDPHTFAIRVVSMRKPPGEGAPCHEQCNVGTCCCWGLGCKSSGRPGRGDVRTEVIHPADTTVFHSHTMSTLR